MPIWKYDNFFQLWLIFASLTYTEVLCTLVSVRVGRTAHLPCNVVHPDPVPPPYVIEWSRKGNSVPIFSKIGKYPKRVNQHFKGRMSLKPDSATLRIQKVSAQDEGWYVCRVLFLIHPVSHETSQQESNGTWVHLVVTATPTITYAPPLSVEGRERESLLLRCRIEGRPKPKITWWKDGWLVRDGENGLHINEGELKVDLLQTSHRGVYECRGINNEGYVEAKTTVNIKAPPELTLGPKNLTVKEKQEAFFSCKAVGYPKNITYKWLYNDVPISQVQSLNRRFRTASAGTLVLYDVNRHDNGHVTCQASNGYGKPVVASAYLVVQYAARVIDMPAEVFGGLLFPLTLTCQVEGEPPVSTVTWRKDGHIITNDDEKRYQVMRNGSLHISSMKYTDEGRYTCTPYNMLGSDGESPQMFLIAKEPPKFTLRPKSEFEVEIETELNLYCDGRGDPTPALRWRKVGTQTIDYPNDRVYWNGGNLTLTSVQEEDHGMWQCILSNPVARITSDVLILVKYTTPQVVTNVTVDTSPESAIVSWEPRYDGGYPQHFIVWYKRSDKGDHAWSTVHVPGNHQREVVSRLEPETVYQFAVLSENVLGSGPFSRVVTKMTGALPTQPTARKVNDIPPPRNLSSSVNDNEILTLSWKKPESMHLDELLGFLVMYRMIHNKEVLLQPIEAAKTKQDSRLRSKRSLITSTFLRDIKRISKRSLPAGLWKISDGQWEIFDVYPPNATTAELTPGRLFRDTWYEFHVLAVTPLAYGPPSQSVILHTSGMMAYALSADDPAEANIGIISGVIAGTLFVLFASSLVLIYCLRHRKGSVPEGAKEEVRKSFLTNQSARSDYSSKPQIQPPSSDVTSGAEGSSKRDHAEADKAGSKDGVLQKIKSRLERGRSNCDVTKRPLIGSKKVKRTQSLPCGNPTKPIAPIYRSTDGKFHVNDHTNEKAPASHEIRRNHTERLHAESDSEDTWKCRRRTEHFRKTRPVSDSFLHHGVTNMKKYWAHQSPRESAIEELDECDASLEIDCSQSNIEVRYIPQNKTNSRRSSYEKSRRVCLSPGIQPDGKTIREKDQYRSMTHYPSDSIVQGAFPHHKNRTKYPQLSPPPLNFQPEYVYLKDLGISCPETPCSDVIDQRSFSPGVDFMSMHHATPGAPPRVKYHAHTLIPGGHYHLSPRGSYSSRSPSALPLLQHSAQKWKEKSTSEEVTQQLYSPRVTETERRQLHENNNILNIHEPPIRSNSMQENKKSRSLSPLYKKSSRRYDDEIVRRPTSSLDEFKLTTPQHNNNNSKYRSSKARGFRAYSCSLPSLSQRKFSLKLGDEQTMARKSVSEELLGQSSHVISEVEADQDTDSDRRFSFTSGSNSTVRHVPSRESNLSSVGDPSSDKVSASMSSFHEDSAATFPVQSPRSEKSSISLSPLIPSEVGGAGSSSGYDSQNTSENSSHMIRPSGRPNKSNVVTNKQRACDALLHSDSYSIQRLPKDNADITSGTVNSTLGISHNSGTSRSTSSSSDTKLRKDISSVDEKYEWDSTVEIESDILEALRRLGTHNRDGPMSKDVIQELQKLNVDRSEKHPTPKNSSQMDPGADDNGTSSESDDDSYSKQTMEQRCAALKEEYLEHKRRVMARKQAFASPDTQR